jgi:hypothetical protein
MSSMSAHHTVGVIAGGGLHLLTGVDTDLLEAGAVKLRVIGSA